MVRQPCGGSGTRSAVLSAPSGHGNASAEPEMRRAPVVLRAPWGSAVCEVEEEAQSRKLQTVVIMQMNHCLIIAAFPDQQLYAWRNKSPQRRCL